MKSNTKYKLFISAFLFLYIIVAFISFMHSIQFFNVGNEYWMSILLGGAYELGQAVVLASILLSDNKKSFLTWFLFIILTCVQIIGNVFSVYKYISLSSEEYYKFIQEPLLFWIQGVDQQSVKVIISWITGALLPIVALGMTGMVASNLQLVNKKDTDTNNSSEINLGTDQLVNPTEYNIPSREDVIKDNEFINNAEKIESPTHIEVSENTKKDLDNVLNSSTALNEDNYYNTKNPLNLVFKGKEKDK